MAQDEIFDTLDTKELLNQSNFSLNNLDPVEIKLKKKDSFELIGIDFDNNSNIITDEEYNDIHERDSISLESKTWSILFDDVNDFGNNFKKASGNIKEFDFLDLKNPDNFETSSLYDFELEYNGLSRRKTLSL